MTNDVDIYEQPREPDAVWKPTGAIDPVRLEALWKLSERIATAAIVPMSLRGKGSEGRDFAPFPHETVVANVFAVVEQADRWGTSPFALLACAAIVHGRLGFEGKVIADVLESRYQIKLGYEWSGKEQADDRTITIIGYHPVTGEILRHPKTGEPLSVKGTVGQWKTSGNGSPWRPLEYDKMLAYRGAREWARMHRPGAIMGTNSIDELYALSAQPIQSFEDKARSLQDRFQPSGDTRNGGFSPAHVEQLEDARAARTIVGEVDTARSREHAMATATGQPDADQPKASASGSDGADRAEPPARLGKDIHIQFSQALLRVSKAAHVGKMADDFWPAHGGWPPEAEADKKLALAIAAAHRNRCDGKLSMDDTKAHVAEIISESYGEGL